MGRAPRTGAYAHVKTTPPITDVGVACSPHRRLGADSPRHNYPNLNPNLNYPNPKYPNFISDMTSRNPNLFRVIRVRHPNYPNYLK